MFLTGGGGSSPGQSFDDGNIPDGFYVNVRADGGVTGEYLVCGWRTINKKIKKGVVWTGTDVTNVKRLPHVDAVLNKGSNLNDIFTVMID